MWPCSVDAGVDSRAMQSLGSDRFNSGSPHRGGHLSERPEDEPDVVAVERVVVVRVDEADGVHPQLLDLAGQAADVAVLAGREIERADAVLAAGGRGRGVDGDVADDRARLGLPTLVERERLPERAGRGVVED